MVLPFKTRFKPADEAMHRNMLRKLLHARRKTKETRL
jgi:hypothetical protein